MHSYHCPSQCSGERSRQDRWRCFAALCRCHLLTQPNSWVWQASDLESPECSWVHGWAALLCTPSVLGQLQWGGMCAQTEGVEWFLPCHSLTHPHLSSSSTDWGPRMLPHQWVSQSVWVILAGCDVSLCILHKSWSARVSGMNSGFKGILHLSMWLENSPVRDSNQKVKDWRN